MGRVFQNRVKGSHLALGTQIQVEEKYEDAIAAALGEYLDLIILGEDVDIETVFKFLENFDKGKVSILPNKWRVGEDRKDEFADEPDLPRGRSGTTSPARCR